MKKYLLILSAFIILAGCVSSPRRYYTAPAPLTEKDGRNAEKMAQILGIRHERILLLDRDELGFALQHREYFADAVRQLGFSAVALPFSEEDEADIECEEGRKMHEFVMFLEMKSLKCVYLLRESFFINRRNGSRFVWGNGNPYEDVLLKLRTFWQELPKSAEMPTVLIALEMNRWNDRNPDRPTGLLFTWRKEKEQKGSSNDRMFSKSMSFFDASRRILELEQVILLVDEEVMLSGEKGALTDGSIGKLLEKSDAVGVIFEPLSTGTADADRLQFMRTVESDGSIFTVISPTVKKIENYDLWLDNLQIWCREADKYPGNAGVLIQNWKKLNKIWRQAQ